MPAPTVSRRPWRALAAVALTTLVASLVGIAPAAAAPTGSGPVNVLYAGSLSTLMMNSVGPAFGAATGYTVQGFSAGSDALASQIKGGIEKGDVFISASPAVNAELEGSANGNWVSWDATFAVSPLEIGYSPTSSFAHAFKTKPWWKVITEAGIQLGRTDPATDPKGVLAVDALDKAARVDKDPALRAITTSTTNVFPEETLVGRLQAGQLDAGFFYAVEASAARIPTVSLGPKFQFEATYTITLLNQAPDENAAIAFINYLLGTKGATQLTRAGLKLTKVTVSGQKSEVPTALRATLHVK